MFARTVLVMLAAAFAASCATTPDAAGKPSQPKQEILLGAAILKAEQAPTPEALAKAMPGLVILEVRPLVGSFYEVRFNRVPDETFTRAAIDAFAKVPGVVSSEPNVISQMRQSAQP